MTETGTERIAVPSPNPFDPNFVVGTGQGYDGVGLISGATSSGVISGSGSLLTGGRHVLTAAHVVDSFQSGSGSVRFDLPEGPVTIAVSRVIVHPGYGGIGSGNDIAILELAREAPVSAERYAIFRGDNEIGQVNTRVGYGVAGNGGGGEVFRDPTAGSVKRFGQNVYDADGAIFNAEFDRLGLGLPDGTTLGFDFDDGTAAHDAFGRVFGIHDTGFGANEVNSTSSDSGGPVFIDGRIAGITSFGLATAISDTSGFTDAGFGEFGGDTRVSAFADWIDGIVPPVVAPTSTDGNDTLIGGTRSDIIAGGLGHDTISGNDGDDVLYGNRNTDVLHGGGGNDILFGGQNDGPETANNNVSAWRTGVETLFGGDGEDVLYGNHGADVLRGENGGDTLYGGQDDDTLEGGDGADYLFGNLDNDRLDGGAGNDRVNGGAGDDRVIGGDGADVLLGESGRDSLFGGAGDDYIQGGDGADVLYGENGRDVLFGGTGNDEIRGGVDPDRLFGEDGNDRLSAARAAMCWLAAAAAMCFTEGMGPTPRLSPARGAITRSTSSRTPPRWSRICAAATGLTFWSTSKNCYSLISSSTM